MKIHKTQENKLFKLFLFSGNRSTVGRDFRQEDAG